jgi:hypothetical protein
VTRHQSSRPLARRVGLTAWLAGLGALLWSLRRAGQGALSTPPLNHNVLLWLKSRQPDVAAFAVFRCVALCLAGYLLAATLISIAAESSGRVRLIRWSAVVTPPTLQRLVSATMGLSLSTALLAGLPVSANAATPSTTVTQPTPPTDPAPSMVLLVPPSPETLTPLPSPTMGLASWTVRPADNFWSIATTVVSASAPGANVHEIAEYWERLITDNAAELRHFGNPSLIYPGQRLSLPPPH